jgi:DNA helicase HerA-like ATPase
MTCSIGRPQPAVHLASDFGLPLDVVTETVAILAKRRAGKSYTARKLVEGLLNANLQVVIVDPKGDWFGIRSSADGQRPGFPVLIAGGEHGAVPLEPGGGEVLARGS